MHLIALLALACVQEEKVQIGWKFQQGDSVRYEMSTKTSMDMGGMEFAQEMLFGFVLDVTGVDDKGAGVLKVTYDHVKAKMDGMMEVDYDSDRDEKPGDDGFSKMMAGMVGKSFTMKISARGDIVEIKGLAELMEAATKDLDENDPMSQMLKNAFTDEQLKSMYQSYFPQLPEEAVAKGATWNRETKNSMPMMGDVTNKTKYTLKEIRGKSAVIGEETKMEFGGDGGGMMEVTEGASKGEIVWSLEAGRMESSKSEVTMKMAAGGQEFTTVTKTETKLAPRKKSKKEY